jgi:hypothetical protein
MEKQERSVYKLGFIDERYEDIPDYLTFASVADAMYYAKTHNYSGYLVWENTHKIVANIQNDEN